MERNRREGLDRRSLVISICAAGAAAGPAHAARLPPIIDTHLHLFDPNRPQGVPYAGARNLPTARTGAFPSTYASVARPLGIVGGIEIEASPWPEDNLWVLETIAPAEIMVGMVGNLKPELTDFGETLDRYHKNPLFRGIRYGNVWKYSLVDQSANPTFIDGLRRLAAADLVLDTANPRVDLLQAVVRVSDAVPGLRIVIDHLPGFVPAAAEQSAYEAVLKELGDRPQIYCKLSAIIKRVDGQVRTDLAPYQSRLDTLFETFGEDRVMFGSDWPNSDGVTPIQRSVALARAFFETKPLTVQEKYFWRNSRSAYRWISRSAAQRRLA